MSASLEGLYASLSASKLGLKSSDAASRLATYGPNEAIPKKSHPLLHDILACFANPLVIILLLAAAASGSLGDVPDAVIIVTIVMLSTILNVVQTHHSRVEVEKLQSSLAPTATALRDGKLTEIARREVVAGDVVRISAGDLVPADCRLIEANDLHVMQAALTGESLPVNKRASGEALKSVAPSESEECVFLGTSVVSGVGLALVVNTGKSTLFGDIAQRLTSKPPETEFERGLRRFGGLILRTVVFLVLFVLLASVVLKRDPLQSLLFAVALAVGLTPEFLPMITTITLSRGAVFMARHGVIVKNLAAIQDFGSMDTLCSDKTGTLTSGQMKLEQIVDAMGRDDPDVLNYARVNSILETGIASPLDSIIVATVGKDASDASAAVKLGEAPFDFERRRMSIVAEWRNKPTLICKGAPEGILPVCKTLLQGGKEIPFEDALRASAVATYEKLSRDGYRVLAVASKAIEKKAGYSALDEADLTLVGYLGFVDPALPEALATINELRKEGIVIKIISGDNQLVTEHVCREVGLDPGKIVVGADIDSMSDVALQHVAEEGSVFARISPAQKNRIILALKARGHVVGYMGDGINDAPSLHSADVGISVSSAVDVAKDAADIILVKPGLQILKDGILQGRMAFGNVMKYLLMGTSSNFGNMFSMAGATVILPFLPMLPTQILLNNLMYDLSQVTIPTDKVDQSYISTPRRWDIGLIRNFMVIIGPLSSVFDFLTFWALLMLFHAGAKEFHTGWFVESLATQVLVIFVIRTMGSPWKSQPSRALAITTISITGLGCLLPFTPVARFLGFVPLPAGFFAFLVVAVLLYLGLVELVKRRLFGIEA